MLTEQRHKLLLELVNKKKSITVTEAKEVLNVSESTIRRDIIALHNAGKLTKVFGSNQFNTFQLALMFLLNDVENDIVSFHYM